MINKLRRFFFIAWRSATDFSYYKDIYQAPFSFSLKYLFALLFFINLVGGIIFAQAIVNYLPKIPSTIEKIKTAAKELYPNDLVVTINNGKLRTNVDEPFFIDFPSSLKNTDKDFIHLITIDTKASVEDIKKYQTVILVTKNALVFPDRSSGYKVQFLTDIKGYYMIDKYAYNTIISKLLPYLNYLPSLAYIFIVLAILVFPFFGAFFSLIGKVLYLLAMGFILWIIAKLMKVEINFSKVFQLSLHGLTIPIVLSTVSQWLNFTMPVFSYSLIFFLLMIISLSRLKEKVRA